jgi:thiol:disulfide interchange protein
MKPLHQAGIIIVMIFFLSGIDYFLPHDDGLLNPESGPWIVSTAMIFLFIILNTIVALMVEPVIPYWIRSLLIYFGLLAFSYGWCYLLTSQHIDEVGSFRWLWMVLTMVYLVFFVIVRSIKRIVDMAIRQDKKLRGEE